MKSLYLDRLVAIFTMCWPLLSMNNKYVQKLQELSILCLDISQSGYSLVWFHETQTNKLLIDGYFYNMGIEM